MKRYKHNLSHYRLLTAKMGQLYPCAWLEVLPGDTLQASTSVLLRMAPMLAPVMHPVQLRLHWWHVPYRHLWDDWETFITGGPDGLGPATGIPRVTAPNDGIGWTKGSLPDYLGYRVGKPGIWANAWPILAFNKIFNEFYRDQDIIPVVPDLNLGVPSISWGKDYLTTARPWPQRGPDVTVPIGGVAPVRGIGKVDQVFQPSSGNTYQTGGIHGPVGIGHQLVNHTAQSTQFAIGEDPAHPGYPNIYADLSQSTGADIRDVRRAFAIQRYQEARSRYGARYAEYLLYLGIRSSDARLQRPEYLGGGKTMLSFSEVLQSSPTDPTTDPDVGVGDLRGHGISALRTRRWRRFFEEHGLVMALMSVRPTSMYQDGHHRSLFRGAKEDFWQRELEQIGQQEVLSGEVFMDSYTQQSLVWGYADRYDEYRSHPSGVSGDFRDTMDHWHLARKFAAPPALNQDFTNGPPSTRIFQVTEGDHLWAMTNHSIQARRLVNRSAAARIL